MRTDFALPVRDAGFERYLTAIRLVFSLVLAASAAFFVYKSLRWQIMWDPSIMHYVNFLMDHGWAPYRDIIDINLPGSYLIEGWAMHLFGGGDLGWRFYDFFLLAVVIASAIVIALPYDWFAGLYAGVLFLLIHAMEGPRNAGQREEVMVALLLAAYALLFTAMRRLTPLLLVPFGFLVGLASSLKPTVAPLGVLLLVMMALALRRRGVAAKQYLGYGVLGMAVAVLVNLNFFWKYHAFWDFLAIARRLVPYYASVGNKPYSFLLWILFTRPFCAALTIGTLLLLVNHSRNGWENWERAVLGVGIGFGAFSYLAQGKDFEHHAYAFEVFVLLCTGLEFAKAMRTRGWVHGVGLATLAFVVLVIVPVYDHRLARQDALAALPDAMRGDLERLGGTSLQGQVQCLDMVDGCFSTLYRLQLFPRTGFMGDYMFFGPPGSQPLPEYRAKLWSALHTNPPKVVVLTNMWLTQGDSFAKVNQWPELMAYLNTAYRLDVERNFGRPGYRVYVLREQPTTGLPLN